MAVRRQRSASRHLNAEPPIGLVPGAAKGTAYVFHRDAPARRRSPRIDLPRPDPTRRPTASAQPMLKRIAADQELLLPQAAPRVAVNFNGASANDAPALPLTDSQLRRLGLSEYALQRLRQPPPTFCDCDDFGKTIGSVFVSNEKSRFVVCQTGAEPRAGLTPDEIVLGFIRMAIHRCPFDAVAIDETIPWTLAPRTSNEAPVCCEWMARAVLAERVRFSDPFDACPRVVLILNDGSMMPFAHCPRCPADMRTILQHRERFSRR